jgi:hypothetical protein
MTRFVRAQPSLMPMRRGRLPACSCRQALNLAETEAFNTTVLPGSSSVDW